MRFDIPINDWPNVLDELLRVLKPNSWLEIVDTVDYFNGIENNDKIKEFLSKGISISMHAYYR